MQPTQSTPSTANDSWTAADSASLYRLSSWSRGHFQAGAKGNLLVSPSGDDRPPLDLQHLLGEVQRRGVQTPILFRFDGILRASLKHLVDAFDRAREEFGFTAPYRPIYPIKVNQERLVVETLLECGRSAGLGLEVGSKAELLAALSLIGEEETLLVCNGYKDRDTLEMAMLSADLGARPIIVVERAAELPLLLDCARRLDRRPHLGLRVRLTGCGAGRWKHSAGDRSKFGLTSAETVTVLRQLEAAGYLDCLELLHFHIGSQITQIRSIKNALAEATRTLLDLRRMGAPIRYFDVGGGLGIDYDGTRTDGDSSRNYSTQEYANDVVYHVLEACRAAGQEEPIILSESGRALTAHHSVLVTEVVGTSSSAPRLSPCLPTAGEEAVIESLADTCERIGTISLQESYHDLVALRERAGHMFELGQLTLIERARADEFYWHGCHHIRRRLAEEGSTPEELVDLEHNLADIYYLNLSFFQSIPDAWAIDQAFPIMPVTRLNERPSVQTILADLTCDSDGMVKHFVQQGTRRSLALHRPRTIEPYHVAFFLVGAYQEILGDLHNLFGDTNIVHVDQDQAGRPRLASILPEESVGTVLSYVEFDQRSLLARLRSRAEESISMGRLSPEDSADLLRRGKRILRGSTYFQHSPSESPTPSTKPSHEHTTGL
ncbi:MAG: biosynthetic arginine decarboxylase [Planctomycetota bacterium]|nr:biosynthetic arginine decarboxylase [Planctomycetota bacterium]